MESKIAKQAPAILARVLRIGPPSTVSFIVLTDIGVELISQKCFILEFDKVVKSGCSILNMLFVYSMGLRIAMWSFFWYNNSIKI